MSVMKRVPVVGETIVAFDDGKVRPSRRYEVTVLEVIPFSHIDKETRDAWKVEVEQCPWLYSTTTDFFVKTDKESFVRTIDGGWFGIGDFFNTGRLDIDGDLDEGLRNEMET